MKNHDYLLIKKAERWAPVLGRLPGVQAIFLSGSLACGTATKNSDIDILVIARAGQIWTARFYVFLILKLCGQLAKEDNHAAKICPNHFLTDHSLQIQEHDAYSAYLFSHLIPLYDPENIWPIFVEQNLEWIERFGEQFKNIPEKLFGAPRERHSIKRSLSETFFEKLQISKIKKNPEYNTPGANIIINQYELRFHPKPHAKTWKK